VKNQSNQSPIRSHISIHGKFSSNCFPVEGFSVYAYERLIRLIFYSCCFTKFISLSAAIVITSILAKCKQITFIHVMRRLKQLVKQCQLTLNTDYKRYLLVCALNSVSPLFSYMSSLDLYCVHVVSAQNVSKFFKLWHKLVFLPGNIRTADLKKNSCQENCQVNVRKHVPKKQKRTAVKKSVK
jgi:hypothetical protein